MSGPADTPEYGGLSRLPAVSRLHLRVGWWSLLVFLTLGLFLETLLGFKAGFYLDVSSSTRRLSWTLAHAHGTLLSLLSLLFGLAARHLPAWSGSGCTAASRCLLGALVLMPVGFFLGGLFVHDGDPGVGILLVPIGGLLLFAAILLTALAWSSSDEGAGSG